MGFRDLLAKAANTPRKTLLLAWLLSVIMFVDEYLNALTTTICLRDVSDKNRLPGSTWRCRPTLWHAACA